MELPAVELERRLGKIEGVLAMNAANILEIKDSMHEIKLQMVAQNGKVGTLWLDRSVWNWAIRGLVIATPIVIVVVNIYSK